ncbi:Threonyl/alanyl tRNA synthetase [Dipodascopsis uninucleata]
MATSTVVGALACQIDSYLQTFDTKVISCRPVVQVDKGKSGKKAKQEIPAQVESGPFYELELEDTILFPEGGGQPTDHGFLYAFDNEIAIRNVRRESLTALHLSNLPLEPNTDVKLKVDWNRRFDHMQQHSGQHLLSAVLDKKGVPTLAWTLGEKVSYVELSRKLTDEEVSEAEDECNEIIRKAINIWIEVPDKDLVNQNKLPDDYDVERGILRVVHIGNLDANPCCGTHLKNTCEIGSVALFHQTPIRGSNSRLYFLIGDRVRKYAVDANTKFRSINSKLSCQTEEIEDKITKLESQLKDALRREKIWMAETVKSDSAQIRKDLELRKRSFIYRPDSSLDYFNSVIAEVGKLENNSGVIVLASGAIKASGALLIIGEGADKVARGIQEQELIDSLKGGGKGLRWQGKITQWKKDEVEHLREYIENLQF